MILFRKPTRICLLFLEALLQEATKYVRSNVLSTNDGAYLCLWSCFKVNAYHALTETAADILPHYRIF